MPRKTLFALASLFVLFAAGCSQLLGSLGGTAAPVRPDPPNVRIAEVRVVQLPTARELAGYYCPQYLNPLVCRAFGGSNVQARFAFDLELEIANPNRVPLPLVQALVAFDAYPDARDSASLGSACVSLCGDESQCSANAADACSSNEPTIHDADSFARATVGFLVGMATGTVDPRNVSVRTVAAGESVRTVVRLELDAPKMLDLMRRLGRDLRDDLQHGRVPSFVIPYEVQGAVWVSVESFGRFAANFGPLRGEFHVDDTQR